MGTVDENEIARIGRTVLRLVEEGRLTGMPEEQAEWEEGFANESE